MNNIIHNRYIIVLSIIFSLFILSSKPSFSSENALLLELNIKCSGKKNDWSKSWNKNFFAISTPYTFQGSRYWFATAEGEGHKKYDGDIGLNIFTGKKTNKDFRIMGDGIYLKNKSDGVFKFRFTSKGNKSIIEHLKQGVEGTGGKDKHRRECIIKLLNQVDAFDGVQVDKYISVKDKKIESLLNQIDNFKNTQEEMILKSKSSQEEINRLNEEFNKQIALLENQISTLIKDKVLIEKKLSESEEKLETGIKAKKEIEKKLIEQEEKQKKVEEKIKKQEEKQKKLEEENLKQKKSKKITKEKLKNQEEILREQEEKIKLIDEKIKKQEQQQKEAEEKLKKREEDLKTSEERRILDELKKKIEEEKKKIEELNKQAE